MKLNQKTAFITGASRGIGLEIAKKFASEGANVILVAKTAEPHPKLEGTIFSAAESINAMGRGKALPFVVDVRDEAQIQRAVEMGAEQFGGIDILVNNASAIQLTGTLQTEMKRYDLMNQVNARGTYACSKICLPYLLKSENPHVISLSPPLNMETKWFKHHVAYSMAKFGMSMVTLGMAGEFEGKVAFNSLWPKTIIATSAIEFAVGNAEMLRYARKPSIMADAALEIVLKDAKTYSGNFLIDEQVLKAAGLQDFSIYKNDPSMDESKLLPDFFI